MASTIKVDEILDGNGNQFDGSQLGNVGKVLQVHNQVFSGKVYQTMNTTEQLVGGIQTSCVAKSSNSKFKISIRWFGEVDGPWEGIFNIKLNGSRVNSAGNNLWEGIATATISYQGDNGSTPEMMNVTTVASPNLSAGTTVTVGLYYQDSGSAGMWTNRCFSSAGANNYETGTSEIIIEEIGA